MKLATMVGMTLYICIFIAAAMLLYAAVAVAKAFRERNRLRTEVAAMHDRSNRASKDYMATKQELERELEIVRARETTARWERDMMVESYQADIKALKKQLAMKDKLLKQTDEILANERRQRAAE